LISQFSTCLGVSAFSRTPPRCGTIQLSTTRRWFSVVFGRRFVPAFVALDRIDGSQ
jgi:hypothetical protein